MSGPTCPRCDSRFASPMDITVHETVLPNGIWRDETEAHVSQCEWTREVRAEQAREEREEAYEREFAPDGTLLVGSDEAALEDHALDSSDRRFERKDRS